MQYSSIITRSVEKENYTRRRHLRGYTPKTGKPNTSKMVKFKVDLLEYVLNMGTCIWKTEMLHFKETILGKLYIIFENFEMVLSFHNKLRKLLC